MSQLKLYRSVLPLPVVARQRLSGLLSIFAVACGVAKPSSTLVLPATQQSRSLTTPIATMRPAQSTPPAPAEPPVAESANESLLPDEAPEEEPQTLPRPNHWATETLKALRESREQCAKVVGYTEPFESCDGTVVGSGSAIALTVVTECGSDSCSTMTWLLRQESPTPLKLPLIGGGGFAFAPDLAFYVVEDRQFLNEADLLKNFYTRAPTLLYVDLATGKTKPFAKCFSPSLSPGGKWFLCRNRRGDVLRVKLAGGKLELVARNATKGSVAFSPYSFTYPDAAYFYRVDELRFRSGSPDDDNEEQTAPWSEDQLPARTGSNAKTRP